MCHNCVWHNVVEVFSEKVDDIKTSKNDMNILVQIWYFLQDLCVREIVKQGSNEWAFIELYKVSTNVYQSLKNQN